MSANNHDVQHIIAWEDLYKFMKCKALLLLPVSLLPLSAVGLEKGTPEDPIRILPIGDSITSWNGGYRAPLQKKLKAAGYHFDFVGTQTDKNQSGHDGDHEGHSGCRINQVYDKIYGNPKAWGGPVEANHSVKNNQPDLILVMLGTNDMRQGLWPSSGWGNPDKTVLTLYGKLIRAMHNDAPEAEIILSGILRNTAGDIDPAHDWEKKDTDNNEPIAPRIEPFNKALKEMVETLAREGIPIHWVNPHDAIPEDMLRDGIHPTGEGFKALGNTFYQGIVEITE